MQAHHATKLSGLACFDGHITNVIRERRSIRQKQINKRAAWCPFVSPTLYGRMALGERQSSSPLFLIEAHELSRTPHPLALSEVERSPLRVRAFCTRLWRAGFSSPRFVGPRYIAPLAFWFSCFASGEAVILSYSVILANAPTLFLARGGRPAHNKFHLNFLGLPFTRSVSLPRPTPAAP